MVENRKAVEKFIDYIDWDKSPNGWGDGQLKKNAPESAKKAYADYKKAHANDYGEQDAKRDEMRNEHEKELLKKATSSKPAKKK